MRFLRCLSDTRGNPLPGDVAWCRPRPLPRAMGKPWESPWDALPARSCYCLLTAGDIASLRYQERRDNTARSGQPDWALLCDALTLELMLKQGFKPQFSPVMRSPFTLEQSIRGFVAEKRTILVTSRGGCDGHVHARPPSLFSDPDEIYTRQYLYFIKHQGTWLLR